MVYSICSDLQNFSGVVVDLHKVLAGEAGRKHMRWRTPPLHDLNGWSSRSAQKSRDV